jgi:chemotaxis protein histidine kinase CheA
MAEAARLRGPDIILRTAPPLSATSDAPLAEVPQIPASASNDPADLAAGVTPEISPQEKAEAVRDKNEPTPNALDSKTGDQDADKGDADPEIDRIQIDGKDVPLPPWMKREITKARNRQRDAEATSKQAADALDALRAEVEALKAKTTQADPEIQVKPVETPTDPRPTRDQFDDPESYDEALTTWATREGERKASEKIAAEQAEADAKTKQAEKEALQAATQARIEKLNADWMERTIKAAERYADFKEVAEGNHTVTNDMALVILHADNGPDIAYYLGKNPEESERIAALPVPLQGHELGKIAARLATPQARTPRPRPLDPIEGGNGPADTSGREPSMEEVAARVNSRYAANRRPFISAEPTRRQ